MRNSYSPYSWSAVTRTPMPLMPLLNGAWYQDQAAMQHSHPGRVSKPKRRCEAPIVHALIAHQEPSSSTPLL